MREAYAGIFSALEAGETISTSGSTVGRASASERGRRPAKRVAKPRAGAARELARRLPHAHAHVCFSRRR